MASVRAKALDRLFRALASAPRREILRLAARQKCAVTHFVEQLDLRQPARDLAIGCCAAEVCRDAVRYAAQHESAGGIETRSRSG